MCVRRCADLLSNNSSTGYDSEVDCLSYPTTLPSSLPSHYQTFVSGKDHFGTYPNGTFISQGYQNLQLYDGLTEEIDHYDQFFKSKMGPDVDPMATGNLSWNSWRGAPYIYEENLHPTSWTSERAINHLQNFDFSSSSSKMFLKASFHRPHSPYDPPKRLYDKYTSMSPSSPTLKRNINPGTWDDKFKNTTEMPAEAWNGDPGEEEGFISRASYLASVEFVDEGIGAILDEINEQGLMDDFFIVWVADHGDMNGDHNLWRKGYPYEESAHVPMVIKMDGEGGGAKVVDSVVEIRDVAVTVWDVVGVLEEVKEKVRSNI